MRPALIAAFVAVVIAANVLTSAFGLVTILGLTATAGTWIAGFGFVARDALQECAGRLWVAAAVASGALLSAIFSPSLAVASGVAFALAEVADWLVYTPLRHAGRTRAAIASNLVGSIVDSLLFLMLAGFPLDGWSTQTIVKVATTTVFILGVRLALPRQSLHATGGGRHA